MDFGGRPYQDFIAVYDGVQTMGYGESSAIAEVFSNGLLYQRVRLYVHIRGCLVQHLHVI